MIKEFLKEVVNTIWQIDETEIQSVVNILSGLSGRVFFIGSGGGAGHASHAAADFNKITNIESYALYDNTSLLTALVNDEGYDTSAGRILSMYNFNKQDCLFVISVGGGKGDVSRNITNALLYAKECGGRIVGIVGRDGGATKEMADACIVIPPGQYVTPVTEGLQAVLWHLIVSHPFIAKNKTKW